MSRKATHYDLWERQKKKLIIMYIQTTVDSGDVDGSSVFIWYEFRRMAVEIQIRKEVV